MFEIIRLDFGCRFLTRQHVCEAALTVVDAAHLPGEKHGCECSQGDVAHLQKHQTCEEDGPRQSQEAPEEIPPSHSPVGTALGTTLAPFVQPEI